MSDDIPQSALDDIVEGLKEHVGGRNLRKEATALRGSYLTRWMDLELNLDMLICEYLEVPENKVADMTDGLLPLIASARAKVEFLNIIVKRVDPESNAYKLTRKAQETRNALAHRPASFASLSNEVMSGAIPFLVYRHGVEQLSHIRTDEALALVDEANEAVFQLTLKARPDYLDRMRTRAGLTDEADPH